MNDQPTRFQPTGEAFAITWAVLTIAAMAVLLAADPALQATLLAAIGL